MVALIMPCLSVLPFITAQLNSMKGQSLKRSILSVMSSEEGVLGWSLG